MEAKRKIPDPFVKLYLAIVDHPKFVTLTDAAWTLWLHGLVYCARNRTDGFIPTPIVRRLCSTANPNRAATELAKAGAWRAVEGGWQMHDYSDWQTTADEIEAKAKQRREGAQLTNHRRWHTTETEPGCPYCDHSADQSSDQSTDRYSDRPAIAPSSQKKEVRRKKSLTVVPTTTTCRGGDPVVVDRTIDLIADYELEIALGSGHVNNPKAYRRRIADRIDTEDRDRITALADTRPDATPEQLRDLYLEPEPLTSYDIGGGL